MNRILELIEGREKLIGIGAVLLVFGLFFVIVQADIKKEKDLEESLSVANRLDPLTAELQTYFSELDNRDATVKTGRKALEITLFLKKPFISSAEVKQQLMNYVNILKYQYNYSNTEFLAGVRFHIYDRMMNYEDGLNPRGTLEYRLTVEDYEKKVEEDAYLAEYNMAWDQSLTLEKMPNYDALYSLVGNYTSALSDQAFTDEEYSFLRKILVYEELSDSDYQRAISLYLLWELGIGQFEDEYLLEMQYVDFYKRALAASEDITPYDGLADTLKTRYAIENPRFLAFILTSYIYDEKLDAKRALVALDSGFYLPLYIEEATALLNEAEGNKAEVQAQLDALSGSQENIEDEGVDMSEHID